MLLAIDTSTRVVGVALYDGVRVLSEEVWASQDYHTVELAPAVAQTLNRVGISVSDLSALAVALGPGSFTGLRIGLSLAKGMSLVEQIPIVGVPTFDILVESQPVRDAVLVSVLRAGRGRLAVGWYQPEGDKWQSINKIEVLTPEELSRLINEPTLVCGELNEEERRLLGRKWKNVILASPAQSLRRPSFLAELGWQRWQAGQVNDPATLVPIYLHPSATIPG